MWGDYMLTFMASHVTISADQNVKYSQYKLLCFRFSTSGAIDCAFTYSRE